MKERFDGIVPWNDEQYYAEFIRDFTVDKQYDVFYQQDYASCYVHPINGNHLELPNFLSVFLNITFTVLLGTVIHPNFAQFSYLGQAMVQYDTVYHWAYYVRKYCTNTYSSQFLTLSMKDEANNQTFNYYDNQATREPKRFDFADLARGFAETWVFMGFDNEPQDQSLFNVPSTLLPLCNAVTIAPRKK